MEGKKSSSHRTRGRAKKPRPNPWEQSEAIPTFLDPEFDNLEGAELDIQDQFRGRSAGDDDN